MKLPMVTKGGSDYKVPEPGIYKMELLAYSDPVASKFNEDKTRFSVTFGIVDDDDFDGAEVRAWYDYDMNEGKKLYKLVRALMGGAEIGDDDEIDLDALIGKRIMGTVDVVEKPRNDGMGMAKFANLMAAAPIKRKKVAEETAAPKRKSAWDDEEDAA